MPYLSEQELKTRFDEVFNGTHTILQPKAELMTNRKLQPSNYMVYSFAALPNLIEKLSALRLTLETNNDKKCVLIELPKSPTEYTQTELKDIIGYHVAYVLFDKTLYYVDETYHSMPLMFKADVEEERINAFRQQFTHKATRFCNEHFEQIAELTGHAPEFLKYMARYVVSSDGTMWFAAEGRPGDLLCRTNDVKEDVPAHSDMSYNVISAGTIFFSADYKRITRISNLSGHFLPPASSLIWSIAALLNLNAVFSEHLVLNCFNGDGVDSVFLPAERLPHVLPASATLSSSNDFKIKISSNGGFDVKIRTRPTDDIQFEPSSKRDRDEPYSFDQRPKRSHVDRENRPISPVASFGLFGFSSLKYPTEESEAAILTGYDSPTR